MKKPTVEKITEILNPKPSVETEYRFIEHGFLIFLYLNFLIEYDLLYLNFLIEGDLSGGTLTLTDCPGRTDDVSVLIEYLYHHNIISLPI